MKVIVMSQTKTYISVKRFGQSLLSLSFNLGGILAGTLLVLYLDVFSTKPWALLLFPGILSVRGATGGLLSGHLSTALHIGTIRPSFTQNTRELTHLSYAVITLTVGGSLLMGLTASSLSLFLLGTSAIDFLTILAVSITTICLSLVFTAPLTFGISVVAFKKGLDPDVFVYPVISSITDIFVTLCYILVLNVFALPSIRVAIGLFDFVMLLVMGYFLLRYRMDEKFTKTVIEILITFVAVICIVNVTGLVFNKIGQFFSDKPEIFLVYPALIDTIGSVGSIVGSTATTKLALGMIDPSFSSIRQHFPEIGSAWGASLILFGSYATIASAIQGFIDPNTFWQFLVQLLMTNILAVTLVVIISFTVAIFAQKRGWNPDNFVIPIESSLADSITTISLFLTLMLI